MRDTSNWCHKLDFGGRKAEERAHFALVLVSAFEYIKSLVSDRILGFISRCVSIVGEGVKVVG